MKITIVGKGRALLLGKTLVLTVKKLAHQNAKVRIQFYRRGKESSVNNNTTKFTTKGKIGIVSGEYATFISHDDRH